MGSDNKRGGGAAKKIATLAIFTALSLITFLIENLFPPLILPGAKMGLSNIFSFAALILYSPWEAFTVVAVRTVLGAVFGGNFSALMYSFTGGIVAMGVSALLFWLAPKLSVLCVSIAAAVMHNITQTAVYILISQTPEMIVYMPYMALLGILSGAIVGAVILLVFKRMPLSFFVSVLGKKKSVSPAPASGEDGVEKIGNENDVQ